MRLQKRAQDGVALPGVLQPDSLQVGVENSPRPRRIASCESSGLVINVFRLSGVISSSCDERSIPLDSAPRALIF